jgi:hypothetical protein
VLHDAQSVPPAERAVLEDVRGEGVLREDVLAAVCDDDDAPAHQLDPDVCGLAVGAPDAIGHT